jgi:hypothetical protein
MGILDEAIREHLELKRQHGADDSELKQLEDEAFGQAERPGDEALPEPAAEAPTQFMEQPEAPEQAGASTRREPPSIADLQEAPPPAEEVPEPASPSTEERQAIAEQPTEHFDIDEELAAEAPAGPSDEELVEEEIAEPRLAPTDPLAGLEEDEEAELSIEGPAPDDDEEYDDEDDAFWNEQRLSDELDQALEAPRDPEPELEEEAVVEKEDEELADEEFEPAAEAKAEAPRHDDDVLEETPDFLEEAPEDDQLWFEQKPPKDFDFDD